VNRTQKIKQMLWRGLYPVWPFLSRTFGFLHKPGRQKYHLGWLASGYNLNDLKKHLSEKWNFGNHFVAWNDEGQVLSWRHLESFDRQYHIRVFSDGEICGHYEYTPESSPIRHFKEIGEEERREKFLEFLGDYVTAEKCVRTITILSPINHEPQFTFEKSCLRMARN
jgi:hypothetical protein